MLRIYRFVAEVTFKVSLALPVPIPDEEKKLSSIFIFTLLCGASKGFNKVLCLFQNDFQELNAQRRAKQLYWNFFLVWVFSCKCAAYFQNIFS